MADPIDGRHIKPPPLLKPRERKPRRQYRHELSRLDVIALTVFAVVAAGATAIALTESYVNLYDFAITHGLHGWRARVAPLCVDTFIVMGETLLFVAFARSWRKIRDAWLAWLFALFGFGMSVSGNIWHTADARLSDRLVSAVFPVTAAAAMAGCLSVVHKLSALRAAAQPSAAPVRETDTQTSAALVSPPPERRTRPAGQANRRAPARPGRRTLADIEQMPGMPPADTVVSAIQSGHSSIRGLRDFLITDYPAVTKHMADQLVKAYSMNGYHTEEK